MKQKWIALAVFGAMLVQVAPISSMTAVALETAAISDVTATDAVLLKYNQRILMKKQKLHNMRHRKYRMTILYLLMQEQPHF